MYKSTHAAAAAAVLALAVAVLAPAATASAAPASAPAVSLTPTLVCLGSTTSSYAPGVTNQARNVRVDGRSTFAPCVGTPAGYTAAASTTFTSSLSCTNLLQQTTGTKTISWSKGGASTFSYTRSATRNALTTVITFTGTISGGQFARSTVVETATALNTDLASCQTTGLTTLGFAEQLVVTGVSA